MDDDEWARATKEETAHHEAGHAVVATAIGWTVHQMRLTNLRLRERDDWSGATDADVPDELWSERILVLLGGGAGEARFAGQPELLPQADAVLEEWDEALALAARQSNGAAAGRALVDEAWETAQKLIAANAPVWSSVAHELSRAMFLSESRCAELLAAVK